MQMHVQLNFISHKLNSVFKSFENFLTSTKLNFTKKLNLILHFFLHKIRSKLLSIKLGLRASRRLNV